MATKTPPTLPGLIDAHCHLDYAPMCDDLEAAFAAARAAGVVQYVHIGCTPEAMDRAVQLAEQHNPVFAVVGVHPHEAKNMQPATLDKMRAHAAHPKVVALGETGLDYFYDSSPRAQQRESFAAHIELGRELDMPIVLHIRDAHQEAFEIIAAAGLRGQRPGMVHCFTGGPAEARSWLDLGFHLSFSGISTFKNAPEIREAAKLCPADRILVETDAPFLSPRPVRGLKNVPAHVAFTCAALAEVRGEAPQALALRAAANTRTLLDMPQATEPGAA